MKQSYGFKWNYLSIFQDVKIICIFKWNIQNFAEKDFKESNWLLIIMGKQAPNCWLREFVLQQRIASCLELRLDSDSAFCGYNLPSEL